MDIGPVDNNKPLPVEKEHKKSTVKETEKNLSPADSVEISTEGRQRLAELADKYLNELNAKENIVENNNDNVERIHTIRDRVKTGFYELPEIKEKIVNKLTDRLLTDIKPYKDEKEE